MALSEIYNRFSRLPSIAVYYLWVLSVSKSRLSKSSRSLLNYIGDVRYLYIEEQSIDFNRAVQGLLSVIAR